MNIPGWKKCEAFDSAQVQFVNGEWWRPAFGGDSLQIALDHVQKQKKTEHIEKDFQNWWLKEGSDMAHTSEEECKRICRIAWHNGAFE